MEMKKTLLALALIAAICGTAAAAMKPGDLKSFFQLGAKSGARFETGFGEVKGSGVSMCKDPAATSPAVAKLSANREVTILDKFHHAKDGKVWFYCLERDKKGINDLGWISNSLVKQNQPYFPMGFFAVMRAETGMSNAETTALWGKPKKISKTRDNDLGCDVVTFKYKDASFVFYDVNKVRNGIGEASTTRKGAGFGGIYVGTQWCNKKYVMGLLGKPSEGAKSNDWQYTDSEGINTLEIDFAKDGTVKKVEYDYSAH
jgi:hypothetical protein